MSEFEVHCPRCRVSFPLGTRTCLHCGGRTRKATSPPQMLETAVSTAEEAPLPPVEGAEEREESAGQSPFRMVTGLIWLVLAVAGTMYRLCAG